MDFATSTTASVLSYAGLGSVPFEILGIIALWILLSLFGFSMGASRLDAIALTLLTATLLLQHLTAAWAVGSMLGGLGTGWIGAVVPTAVLVTLCYLAFLRLCDAGFSDGGGIISAALSALAVVIIILSLWAASFTTIYPFPGILTSLFASAYTFWWLVGALGALALARQKRMWD